MVKSNDASSHSADNAVVDWLLDSDPAIRCQVMGDLTQASAETISAERSRIAWEGWGKRLLGHQRSDGQWGDGVTTRSGGRTAASSRSFHTTICVLEGLLAFETAYGNTPPVTDARRRAHEYLLERRLLRRLSTGEIIDSSWTTFSFPTLWHYDVLRALDYLRAAHVAPDSRVEEVVGIVRERRQDSGRWLLDVRHRNTLYEDFAGGVGEPNRWLTLRARRVLDWADGGFRRFSHAGRL
jgi:hypothetical protein